VRANLNQRANARKDAAVHPILNRPRRVLHIAVTLLSLVGLAAPARADIYQWEYINPADPSQGKQQSTTLAPSGAGVDAVPGANLAGYNLTKAYLIGADLNGADLSSNCALCGLLPGDSRARTNLTEADLSYADLRRTSFQWAVLTNATFIGANIQGAMFEKPEFSGATGISLTQLYSTASYQARDLRGVDLRGNNLAGANFVGQNLASASLGHSYRFYGDVPRASATLTGADFSHANLIRASCIGPVLTEVNFTGADARGASFRNHLGQISLADATTTNLIHPDGHINGLDLDGDGLLLVRDFRDYYNSSPTLPIKVYQHMAMGPGGALRMVFESDAWDSTISFAPGIPVALGGTLELTFADDVNPAAQLGRTFDLFNWTGVAPTGAFTIATPYAWDLSSLYTTGEVTLTAIPEPATVCLVVSTLICGRRLRRRFRAASPLDKIGSPLSGSETPPTRFFLPIAAAIFSLFPFAASARADIFQWEYINPADPSQGKRRSTTLAPDGAGVDAAPGAYLVSRNLTMAYLIGADLSGADFSCVLCGLGLPGPPFFRRVNLTDADLSQANLSNTMFQQSVLTNTNFSGAGLINAKFSGANLTGADLTGADARGAYFGPIIHPGIGISDSGQGLFPGDAVITNLIRPDGHIDGLDLEAGDLLLVRDYDGDFRYEPAILPIPITIDQHLTMVPGGALRMVFEADAWDSTISFAPGIPVTLGGTLELTFAADVNLASQIGRTFDLFNWTGVTPTGAFAIASPYRWNLSNLYATGQVTLTAIPEPAALLLVLTALILTPRRAAR
jgi:uncharacterized protein YjbI with pentapeptide repeats